MSWVKSLFNKYLGADEGYDIDPDCTKIYGFTGGSFNPGLYMDTIFFVNKGFKRMRLFNGYTWQIYFCLITLFVKYIWWYCKSVMWS